MLNLFTTTASIATWHASKSGFLVATEMASLLKLSSQQISDRDY